MNKSKNRKTKSKINQKRTKDERRRQVRTKSRKQKGVFGGFLAVYRANISNISKLQELKTTFKLFMFMKKLKLEQTAYHIRFSR